MEPQTARDAEQAGGDRLYTLSEVSQRTGISMPTLQRYKKLYQGRIPAVGKGRKQRYPERALPVFQDLKRENAGKRGRPRKDAGRGAAAAGPRAGAKRAGAPRAAGARKSASKRGRPAAAAPAAKRRGRPPGRPAASARGPRSGNLLTLTRISKDTGISYPTLVRYVKLYSHRLPSEGTGRSRRFYPEAVGVFRELRAEGGRGGRRKGTAKTTAARGGRGRGPGRAAAGRDEGIFGQRLRQIERAQERLEKTFRGFVQSLQRLVR
jgi:hypothetical protein